MLIKIDKFDGGISEFKEFAKRQWVLEVTGAQPVGRVKVGPNAFSSAAAFKEWADGIDQAGFDKLRGEFVEFPDAGAVSLE